MRKPGRKAKTSAKGEVAAYRRAVNGAAEVSRRTRVLALYRNGQSTLAIGRRLGLSAEGVRQILVRAGAPRRPRAGGMRTGRPPALPSRLVAGYRAGALTIADVARRCGVSPWRARRALQAAGADTARDARRLARYAHANGRRDDRAVALYRRGAGLRAVGRRIGLSAQAVLRILRRRGVPCRPPGRRAVAR